MEKVPVQVYLHPQSYSLAKHQYTYSTSFNLVSFMRIVAGFVWPRLPPGNILEWTLNPLFSGLDFAFLRRPVVEHLDAMASCRRRKPHKSRLHQDPKHTAGAQDLQRRSGCRVRDINSVCPDRRQSVSVCRGASRWREDL